LRQVLIHPENWAPGEGSIYDERDPEQGWQKPFW